MGKLLGPGGGEGEGGNIGSSCFSYSIIDVKLFPLKIC